MCVKNISKNQANYEDAKKFCDDQNLALLKFDSTEEISKVSDYLQYIGTPPKFFTSCNYTVYVCRDI
jgi:hypothetical protein